MTNSEQSKNRMRTERQSWSVSNKYLNLKWIEMYINQCNVLLAFKDKINNHTCYISKKISAKFCTNKQVFLSPSGLSCCYNHHTMTHHWRAARDWLPVWLLNHILPFTHTHFPHSLPLSPLVSAWNKSTAVVLCSVQSSDQWNLRELSWTVSACRHTQTFSVHVRVILNTEFSSVSLASFFAPRFEAWKTCSCQQDRQLPHHQC